MSPQATRSAWLPRLLHGWRRLLFVSLELAVAWRHCLRLNTLARLMQQGVLFRWPWRIPWPWLAGASLLILVSLFAWNLALVRQRPWAWRVAPGVGLLYLAWNWFEAWAWGTPLVVRPRWPFAALSTVALALLWWSLFLPSAFRPQQAAPMMD